MLRPVTYLVGALVALGLAAGSAQAATKINFILNWIAGGDHAPYYYAQKMGWYKQAGRSEEHTSELQSH